LVKEPVSFVRFFSCAASLRRNAINDAMLSPRHGPSNRLHRPRTLLSDSTATSLEANAASRARYFWCQWSIRNSCDETGNQNLVLDRHKSLWWGSKSVVCWKLWNAITRPVESRCAGILFWIMWSFIRVPRFKCQDWTQRNDAANAVVGAGSYRQLDLLPELPKDYSIGIWWDSTSESEPRPAGQPHFGLPLLLNIAWTRQHV
jgi:hypothetical protein